MKNILVTVDFEEKNYLLVEKAAEFAEKFGAKVWLIHIAMPDPDFVGFEVGPQYIRDSFADDLRKEHQLIQKYSADLNAKGIKSEGLLIQGPTVEMILKESDKLNIDLVILGHHQHGYLYKIFVGSTDAEIISQSKVPVLVVPI